MQQHAEHEGLGRSDYETLCASIGIPPDYSLTPVQRRAALPRWLSTEMISTAAAREKTQRYGPRHLTPQDPPAVADVLIRMHCLGDEMLALQIGKLLVDHRVPGPVRDFTIQQVTFVVLGVTVFGFCASTNLKRGDGEPRRPWLLVMTANERFEDILAHELAHCWTLPSPLESSVNGDAVWQSAFYATPLHHVPDQFIAEAINRRHEYERDEDVADRLIASWGFNAINRP